MLNDKRLLEKVNQGEGLTVDEIKRYHQLLNRRSMFTASTERSSVRILKTKA